MERERDERIARKTGTRGAPFFDGRPAAAVAAASAAEEEGARVIVTTQLNVHNAIIGAREETPALRSSVMVQMLAAALRYNRSEEMPRFSESVHSSL